MNEAAFSFNSRQNSTKNQITEPGSLADLLPALMGNAGSCAKCGSDGKEPNAHGKFENHAHKKVRRPSAYISTHSLLSNMVLLPPFSEDRAGTSQDKRQASSCGRRLLYVYHTADCSPLWCVVGCVVLYRTRRRPLVRCRSPPNVQDSQKFLNIWRTRPCGIEIMDK